MMKILVHKNNVCFFFLIIFNCEYYAFLNLTSISH
jgi:hypothetical protein